MPSAYTTSRRIEFRDTDAAGIAHFSVFFTMMEEAEHEFLRHLGLSVLMRDEKGRWILFGEGDTELAVSGVIDGSVQRVIIDRIRIDEDGVHWIVDYKTGTHEGGDLAGFLQQETDRYRPQLERYAGIYGNLTDAPVKTALYFPLLQEFVELD